MKRNLKALGLALVAVFALSATMASGASAQGMITSPSSFWLHGDDEPGTTTPLEAFGGTTECEHATYTGGKVAGTTGTGHHEALASGAKAFTVTPQYTNCKANGIFAATITMNGCDYVIRILGTKEAGVYNTEADLVCPEGQEVTLDVWLQAPPHPGTAPHCVSHIPPQSGLKGATLKQETKGHITLGGTVEGISITDTASPCNEFTHRHTNAGKLKLAVTITGENKATAGSKVSLTLSH